MNRRTLRWTAAATAVTVQAAAAYVTVVRPWLLRWGATDEETVRPLPGDDLVARPRGTATRAVSIEAPVAEVWPWLVQLGQGRGGLYSYDWLENLIGCDIHSVDRIVPELQDLKPGDAIRLVREDYPVPLFFEVTTVEPEHALVLHTPGDSAENLEKGLPDMSWALIVEPLPDGRTRLIARTRTTFKPTLSSQLWNGKGLEPFAFLMERRMLLGIKERAEMWAGRPPMTPAEEPVSLA